MAEVPDPRAAALAAAAQEIQDKSGAANMTLRTALENFNTGRTMQVPGNAAISFETELTQAQLEAVLTQQDILERLSDLGFYPVVTVESKGNA